MVTPLRSSQAPASGLTPPGARHLRQRPLAKTIGGIMPSRQDGFSLLGILIVTAISSAVIATAYTAYDQNHRASLIASASASAATVGQRIRTSYASQSDFSNLSTPSALHDGIYPASTLDSGGQPVNPWGGAIEVAGVPKSFLVTYEKVDANDCAHFSVAAGTGWQDVKINGTSAMKGSTVSVPAAAMLCKQSPATGVTVQFVGTRNAGMVGAPLTACVVQPPQTQMVACPAGQISAVPPYSPDGIQQSRSSFCNLAYGALGWSPWSPVSNTCAPVCSAPPPTTDTQSATGTCPAGQVTSSGSTSFSQTKSRSVSYSCPAPTGSYLTTNGPWSSPSPLASAVCSPACVAPPPDTQTKTQNEDLGCTGGWVGQRIFSVEYSETRTASCPTPTGAVAWTPYSPWTATGNKTLVSNTCAAPPPPPPPAAPPPSCGLPPPMSQRTQLCPAGQIGTMIYTQTWVSAPAPTCWEAGTETLKNTCTPIPPPPPPTCPAGDQYIGSTGSFTPVQIQGGPYGAMSTYPNVSSFNVNMLAMRGMASGTYTVKISYLGQSTTVTASCKALASSADYCDYLTVPSSTITVNLAGGTFKVGVSAWIPIGGSGPMGASGSASLVSKAPGC